MTVLLGQLSVFLLALVTSSKRHPPGAPRLGLWLTLVLIATINLDLCLGCILVSGSSLKRAECLPKAIKRLHPQVHRAGDGLCRALVPQAGHSIGELRTFRVLLCRFCVAIVECPDSLCSWDLKFDSYSPWDW